MTQGFVTPVIAALTNPVTNDPGVKLKFCVTAFFFEITEWPAPEKQITGTQWRMNLLTIVDV